MVSDFRDKWESDTNLKREYDQLIKSMVLLSVNQSGMNDSEEAPILKVIELIQQIASVFRRNLDY